MGWVFIVLGLLLIGVGGFLTYYGQDILHQPVSTPLSSEAPVLSPIQERLLELVAEYQKKFAADKLIIIRANGDIHFDGESNNSAAVSLIKELHGTTVDVKQKADEFQKLMESMPSEYIRLFGESRWGNPFVVSITEKGLRYLHFGK